ncbi:hypothetical protein SLE2022_382450 [Rubroshorea leprosula]
MNGLSLSVFVFTMYGLLITGFTDPYFSRVEFGIRSDSSESSETHKYDRIDEVKKQCKSVLSSASELRPEVNRAYNVKEELNFVYGDWDQEVGDAPIMPFDDKVDIPESESPLKLVSFRITDVDQAHQTKKYVSVSGILLLGITLDNSLGEPYEGNLKFQIRPGHTQLTILFEGIYTETKLNGGERERVMCLLGNTMLPSRESDKSHPWEWLEVSNPNYNQPPLLQDDQILLVLHYPMTFTLTSRVIRGEMKSLNPKANSKYFDEVHIFSQLPRSARYEFGAHEVVSKACDPYPYSGDSFMNSSIDIYKGTGFCRILEEVTNMDAFMVVPNWRCNGTTDYCSKLGPFASDEGIKATYGSFKNVQLYMQDVTCELTRGPGNSSSAKVAAVFRVAPPSTNQYRDGWRSALNNMTLAAEGVWKSSSGQLCMIGCLGPVDAEGSSCNSRICLYILISFSIKQRSIISGSISGTDRRKASYFPLSFEKLARSSEFWNYYRSSYPYYKYSKIKSAGTILEKVEPFSFGTVIKKSLLQFPKLEDAETYLSSLSLLAEDLTLHISAVADPFHNSHSPRIDIGMQILSVGPLFGRSFRSLRNASIEEEKPYFTKDEYTEKQLLLNVSAQLMLSGNAYSNFSFLFVEGLYDPSIGNMYLVGCRDVRASWQILFASMDLEEGLDCLIEVIVSYPPTTSRWLVQPIAEISIASQRTEDDPLHFDTVKLRTFPIMYRKQREDILSRSGVEGILRFLTLSLAVASVTSQLFYIKHKTDFVPFISLVMLGVQALGYGLPLITGAEALFKRGASESDVMPSYNLERSQWINMINYMVKLLVLVMFLLTLRLCQKVWKSRVRLLSRAPLEPHRVPSDKQVLITTVMIHVIGYLIILIIHTVKAGQRPLQTERFIDSGGQSQTSHGWETELEEYIGLAQDFFLLPQVIGNFVWQLNCKPLREHYFIGITAVRLLPHLYDYIRAPIANPYFVEDYEFVNPRKDFYSKFGDIAIPITAIFLATAVYIQQKWDYDQLKQILRFLPLGSRKYERLPSKSTEAELASSVNGNALHRPEHDDEE